MDENRIAVTDPNGNITGYVYDDFGQLTAQESRVTGLTTYAYDSAGNKTRMTDARGVTTTRRRRTVMLRYRLLVMMFAGAILGCAGGGDYEKPLSNGYFLARVSSGKFCIVAPDRHTVVVSELVSYRLDHEIVAGQVHIPMSSGESYFLLNTRTRSLTSSLSRPAWLRQRNVLGLRDHSLTPPRPAGVMWPSRRL